MIAKIYQSGKYCESVQFDHFEIQEAATILYCQSNFGDKVVNGIKALIPHSMMIIFDNSGLPDYDKIEKDLREKKNQ